MSTLTANASNTENMETYSIKGANISVPVPTAIVKFSCSTSPLDGLKVIERFFNVPLDYAKPEGNKIRVFARHIIPKDKAKTLEEEAKLPFRGCPQPAVLARLIVDIVVK